MSVHAAPLTPTVPFVHIYTYVSRFAAAVVVCISDNYLVEGSQSALQYDMIIKKMGKHAVNLFVVRLGSDGPPSVRTAAL